MLCKELDDLEPFDVQWELPPQEPEFGKHGAEEITLYLARKDGPAILVNEARATLFRPGDCLTITCRGHRRRLCFEVSAGDFTGHIMPVSRSKREPTTFSHYAIVLRTLRRPAQCGIRMVLEAV